MREAGSAEPDLGVAVQVQQDWQGAPPVEVKSTGGMFDSLRNPSYRLYWVAMMGQMGAMNMQMVARSWFVYSLTGSTTLLGLTAVAGGAPMLLFSLWGGVMADKVQKKYILVVGQAASGVLSLVIGVLISVGLITGSHPVAAPTLLVCASVLQGIVMALMMPSRQAIIPEIVGEEGLNNAVALNVAGMNINRLLVPSVAGFLIAVFGIETVYYAMTGLYAVAMLFVLPLPRTSAIAIQGGGALSEIANGLRYISRSSVLPALLVITLLSVIFSMPYMMLLTVFTSDVVVLEASELAWMTNVPGIGGLLEPLPSLFAKDSFRLGVLMTVSGIGAVVGSLAIAGLVRERRRGLVLLGSLVLLGLSLLGFSASHWYFISLLLVIPVGLGQAGRMSLSNALVQANTEDAYRGRVMSVYMMEFGVSQFATFAVAIIAGVVGVQWAIGGTSAILLLIGVFALLFQPQIRKLQ